ncbi:MAG TPA: alkaline phosphatase family protein [Nevskiaceae bacterium]|nr:alkaline phosphatase family protein [Nevskiaceae bacterium]
MTDSSTDRTYPKTLFIGLDGCTYTVLDNLTSHQPDVGVVTPFLKKVFENGSRARLRSTPNPLTPPAWTTIMTGKGPGQHGVFDFIRAEDKGGQMFWTLYDCRDIDSELIWSIASRKKRTVAALNFPLTAPAPANINGAVVPGFVPAKHLRRNTHPRELFERMKQDIPGFSPKALAWDFDNEKQAMDALSPEDTWKWVSYHLPREEQWFKIAEYILGHDRPDLMAVMFDGTDKIQHQAWQYLDPAWLPKEPTDYDRKMRQVCLDYYRHLDRYIERLVTLAGPETQVFFASDHGFTASTEVLRINTYLGQLGHLKWATQDGSAQAVRREAANFANLDWAHTVAYCRTPSSNGVHIRVAEKPGDPGIQPEDYEAFREQLIGELKALRNAHGEPVVVDVLKREEWFPGPHMKLAADLTLVLRDHGFVSIRNLEPAVQDRPHPAGTHHPDGIFMAYGPGVARNGLGQNHNIVDVCPTLLHSLGISIPSDFEGRPATDFLTPEWNAAHSVKAGRATEKVGQREAAQGMDAAEKKKLIEQLQMLGYME